jgi:hypothetical protein
MSNITANETHNVSTIRKAIDYFGHQTAAPELYSQTVDINREFASTEYCRKITWLKMRMMISMIKTIRIC